MTISHTKEKCGSKTFEGNEFKHRRQYCAVGAARVHIKDDTP